MDNTLMKVTQLPVIEEHLMSRKEQTEQRVAEAMSLVCTDETLTSVKNIRAEMNRDFLSFGQTGVRVDMASARAKTPKKLMEQIKLKVDGVAQDMKTIGTMGENAPEIMVEYKKNLDLSLAISVVNERHRRAEEEREVVKRRTEMEEARAAGAPVREDTGAAAPQVVPKRVEQAAVERLTVSFRVTDTRERLRLLKQFLVSNGYQYE